MKCYKEMVYDVQKSILSTSLTVGYYVSFYFLLNREKERERHREIDELCNNCCNNFYSRKQQDSWFSDKIYLRAVTSNYVPCQMFSFILPDLKCSVVTVFHEICFGLLLLYFMNHDWCMNCLIFQSQNINNPSFQYLSKMSLIVQNSHKRKQIKLLSHHPAYRNHNSTIIVRITIDSGSFQQQ